MSKSEATSSSKRMTIINEDTKAVCLKEGLKHLGFTEKLIAELLPEPFKKRIRPINGVERFCYLWDKEDVEKAMDTPLFKRRLAARDKNKEVYHKRAEVMREKKEIEYQATLAIIESKLDKIKSPKRYDLDQIRQIVVSEELVEDLMVEHILKNLTEFYKLLPEFDLKRHTGRNAGYNVYLRAYLDKVKVVYPELSEACDRLYSRMSKPEDRAL